MPRAASRTDIAAPAVPGAVDLRFTAVALVIALVLVVASYANGIHGEFVYDDVHQIANNPLIQDPRLLGKALTSDVWAFRGEEGTNQSNYWRPVFVAWLAAMFRSFGTDPLPWHVSNIVLHGVATVLAFFAMSAAGARRGAAAMAAWVFAAHPVHVESVTWISGSPDPLAAIFLFASYSLHLRSRGAPSAACRTGSWFLFAAALLCKEIAIVLPAIVFVTEFAGASDARGTAAARVRPALRACAPFLAVGALYFAVRLGVIGMRHIVATESAGYAEILLNAPQLLVFYLRHAVVPFGLAPSYPLRLVAPASAGFANLVLPAALSAAALWSAYLLWRRGPVYRVGLAWLFLPLAPVFDVRSFPPEDLVHDRYLYLPVLGIAVILGTAACELALRFRPAHAADRTVAAVAGLPVAVALMLATRAYTPVWTSDIALWERAAWAGPEAAFPHSQLGEAYRRASRLPEARRALERALELNPRLTNAHLALGGLAIRENRLDEAERQLQRVLESYPDHGTALEQLALAYQKQGKNDAAIDAFERARRAVPLRDDIYTVNIAVLHRLANRSDEALAALESIRGRLETATEPQVLRAWWYLGELYRERGSTDRAIAAYRKYLSATARRTEPEVVSLRKIVADALERAGG